MQQQEYKLIHPPARPSSFCTASVFEEASAEQFSAALPWAIKLSAAKVSGLAPAHHGTAAQALPPVAAKRACISRRCPCSCQLMLCICIVRRMYQQGAHGRLLCTIGQLRPV